MRLPLALLVVLPGCFTEPEMQSEDEWGGCRWHLLIMMAALTLLMAQWYQPSVAS